MVLGSSSPRGHGVFNCHEIVRFLMSFKCTYPFDSHIQNAIQVKLGFKPLNPKT